MARGSRTPTSKAGQVMGLKDLGYGQHTIARLTSVPVRTVAAICEGSHGWDEIMRNDVIFAQYRREAKRELQTSSLVLAKKALEQIEAKMDKASAAQAAVIFAILRDKERLDAGEPTEHHAHWHKHEVRGLDELAARLSQALISKQDDQPKQSSETQGEQSG